MMTQQELQDRVALKDLVDRYATESDKNNQDHYREIFTPDIKLKVYFGDTLGMDINNVEDMIAKYKAFGAAKASFHQNGQQVVDFTDETHATGICYAIATLVTEEDGKDNSLCTPCAITTSMSRQPDAGGSPSVNSTLSIHLFHRWFESHEGNTDSCLHYADECSDVGILCAE